MVTALIVVLAFATAQAETPRAVYYLPFGAETYIASTPSVIRKEKNRAFELSGQAPVLLRMLQAPKSAGRGRFESDIVRLYVEFSDHSVYMVDQDGDVKNGQRVWRMSKAQLSNLERFLEKHVRMK